MRGFVVPLAIGAAVAVVAFLLDVPLSLGAHPFWAEKVLFVGAPIGLVFGLLATRLPTLVTTFSLIALTAGAFAVAHYGKTRFAASYAEDAFAGQMWFFGWHATVAFAVAAVVAITARIIRA